MTAIVVPLCQVALASGQPLRCEALFRPASLAASPIDLDESILLELSQLRIDSMDRANGPMGSFLKAKFIQALDLLTNGDAEARRQLIATLARREPRWQDSEIDRKKKIDIERQSLQPAVHADLWLETDIESATMASLDDRHFNTSILGDRRGSGVAWSGHRYAAVRAQFGPMEIVRTIIFDVDQQTMKPWVFGAGTLGAKDPVYGETMDQKTRLFDLETGQLILSTDGELLERPALLTKDFVIVRVGPPNKKAQFRYVPKTGPPIHLGEVVVGSSDGSRIAYFDQDGVFQVLETRSGIKLPVASAIKSGKPSRREIHGESAISIDVQGRDFAYFVEDNTFYPLPLRNISWDQIGDKILSQRLFDPATNQLSLEIQDLGRGQVHRSSGTRALVSPNQRWAMSVGGDGGTKTALLDLQSGNLKLLEGRFMKFSNDSRWISESLMFTTQPALMDLATGARYRGHAGRSWTPLSFGDAVLVESEHGQLVIADGAVIPYEIPDLHGGQTAVFGDSRQHTGFSPEGRYIVTSQRGKIVFLKIRP